MSKIPKTLEECYEEIYSMIGENTTILEGTEDDFNTYTHMSGGRWIRNNWGLWERKGKLYKWFISLGLGHADDMSGIILTSFYRQHHGHPVALEGQVQHYKNFWEHQNVNPLTLEGLYDR